MKKKMRWMTRRAVSEGPLPARVVRGDVHGGARARLAAGEPGAGRLRLRRRCRAARAAAHRRHRRPRRRT